jgi:chromosomal replication initiation ATPase DnaA
MSLECFQTPHDRMRAIIRQIAREHGVGEIGIMGRSNVAIYMKARKLAIAAIKIETRLSDKKIARFFNRDESSIRRALGRKKSSHNKAKVMEFLA